MKQYIVDLTNNLIASEKLRREYAVSTGAVGYIAQKKKFVYNAQLLIRSELERMKPETLGKILGELEIGDVLADRQELLQHITFHGDCSEVLKDLAATALAYVIHLRLGPFAEEHGVPPYRGR